MINPPEWVSSRHGDSRDSRWFIVPKPKPAMQVGSWVSADLSTRPQTRNGRPPDVVGSECVCPVFPGGPAGRARSAKGASARTPCCRGPTRTLPRGSAPDPSTSRRNGHCLPLTGGKGVPAFGGYFCSSLTPPRSRADMVWSSDVDHRARALTGRNIDVSGQRERPAQGRVAGVRKRGQVVGP
jgi:hypothetical protein